jgi:hypothetical protein
VPRIEDTPRCEFFFRRLKVSTYLFLMVLSCSTTLTPWQIFRITITHNHSTLHVILQNQRKHVIQVNASVKTVLFSARKIQQMYPIKPAEREDSRVKARKEGF